ncbi:MAG: hypothetical protein HYZ53_13975 [Planctomycetes bacterium]|nr:hypothetical protein [Planctomycetota bacterium]
MPKDEFDHDDPMALVGVEIPASNAEVEAFTRAVIEEYALLGYRREMILQLFRAPQFRATHDVYRARGEAYVEATIDRVIADWQAGCVEAAQRE